MFWALRLRFIRNGKMIIPTRLRLRRTNRCPKRSIAVQVSDRKDSTKRRNERNLGAENETINRELEKQFNESLQSKITHARHGGLGFQSGGGAASSSNDWRDQSAKTAFVPASAPVQQVSVEETTSTEEEKEKKKKKKKERKSSDS